MMSKKDREKNKRTVARDWAKKQDKGFEPMCVKLPDGITFFKLDRLGPIQVDFLCYKVGEGNPRADPGMEHFEREYQAHRIPTPTGVRPFCCRKIFGKPCAVCDWLVKNGSSADPDLVKRMRAVTRHLWVVNDKPGDPDNPLKVFDSGHYNKGIGFGEQMAEAIQCLGEDEDPFALEKGYTAHMTVKEQSFPGVKYNGVTRIDFKRRAKDYPPDMIDKAPCLDECLADPGYDYVKQLLEQGDVEGEATPAGRAASDPLSRGRPARFGPEDDEDRNARSGKAPRHSRDDDEDDEDDDRNTKSRSSRDDEDDEDDRPVRSGKASRSSRDDEDADDDRPSSRAGKPAGKASRSDDEDDDLDVPEDDEEDRPVRRPGRR